MSYDIHPTADVQTSDIGDETVIWQFAVVLPGAKIGKNCSINCHTFIENDVVLGDNCTLKSGVYLWNGIKLGDNVFIGPNVTFTNDKFPRSKKYPETAQRTEIKNGVSIGAASTILGGITIGENAMIGAGSLVTKSVPAGELWFGVPAQFIRKTED